MSRIAIEKIATWVTLAALLTIALTGCSYFSGASPRDVATLVLYAAQHKQLVFVQSPCGGLAFPNNPNHVSAWVREGAIKRIAVVCKSDCTDCRIVVSRKGQTVAQPVHVAHQLEICQ